MLAQPTRKRENIHKTRRGEIIAVLLPIHLRCTWLGNGTTSAGRWHKKPGVLSEGHGAAVEDQKVHVNLFVKLLPGRS
jgi:hypothetical protein